MGRTFFITFLPGMLSPLHIAGHKLSIDEYNREKEITKWSKKMLQITTRFSKDNSELSKQSKQLDNVELFYIVYNRMDDLTLKELKILRKFCYALRDKYDLTIKRDHEKESEDDIYEKYSDIIDNFIDGKRLRK